MQTNLCFTIPKRKPPKRTHASLQNLVLSVCFSCRQNKRKRRGRNRHRLSIAVDHAPSCCCCLRSSIETIPMKKKKMAPTAGVAKGDGGASVHVPPEVGERVYSKYTNGQWYWGTVINRFRKYGQWCFSVSSISRCNVV